jgi:hypothetical protein
MTNVSTWLRSIFVLTAILTASATMVGPGTTEASTHAGTAMTARTGVELPNVTSGGDRAAQPFTSPTYQDSVSLN